MIFDMIKLCLAVIALITRLFFIIILFSALCAVLLVMILTILDFEKWG